MPPDISDLRSQDLLSTLSGVGVDIDRMFEEVSKTPLAGYSYLGLYYTGLRKQGGRGSIAPPLLTKMEQN